MSERKNVFLVEYIHPEARKLLAENVNIIDDWEKLPLADALINRNQVKVTKEFLDRAVNLRIIGIHGTGMDAVNIEETKKRNIEVFSTPGLNAKSVAELNVALAMALSRNICFAANAIKSGKFMEHAKEVYVGNEISGKIIGFIGMGNISRQTADMLRLGFGARIIGWSRSLTESKAAAMNITCCGSKEEVLKQADIIIMGLALNSDTYHIIGYDEFKLCKPTAVFINAARGALVNEQALYQALKEGLIKKAACDVFEKEPVSIENPLVLLDNFIAVPHLGGNTDEALHRVGMAVVEGVLQRLGI